MLTKEMNERLTRVGRGTPGGELMRRYWLPVAACAEMQDKATLKVRLLGEDLALFRDRSGGLGLIAELCPHRCGPLSFGVPESNGIRCPYHGWLFDNQGNCLEQPSESPNSMFKNTIKATAYPVREMGGLFWTYMGPGEPPVLPKYDYFVQPNTLRQIAKVDLPCNWLQIMENSLDPIHSEWLHSYFGYYLRTGQFEVDNYGFPQARHAKLGFDVTDYGIVKRRYYKGGSEEDNDWKIGHPVIFPNVLKVANTLQIRVPIDDENTTHYVYDTTSYPGVKAPEQDVVPVYDYPYRKENGEFSLDWVLQQDYMVWIKQGPIVDRTIEHLCSSDYGVVLFRKLLDEMISKVEAGEDPICVLRNPEDDVQIDLLTDVMVPALTATSVRSLGRLQSAADTGVREQVVLDPEVVAKEMRMDARTIMPLVDEAIQMRLEYLRLCEAAEQ